MEFVINKMNRGDWEQVRAIYIEGIATGHATFEAEAPEWEKWDSAHLAEPRIGSPGRKQHRRMGRFESGFAPFGLFRSGGSEYLYGSEIPWTGNR